MAERKPPWGTGGPGREGFTRIPEPGGGGASVSRFGMTPKVRARVARGVYKAAKSEANRITESTQSKRRATRTAIQEKSSSDHWKNQSDPGAKYSKVEPMGYKKAANKQKGRGSAGAETPSGALRVKGNPVKDFFKMKMEMASKGNTHLGKLRGQNDNVRKKK